MKSEINQENKKNFWRSKPVSFFAHLFLFLLIGLSFFPLADLYYHNVPPMGGDFYQTSTYFSYYSRFMNWPSLAWKYVWYGGVPAVFDYPWLHMYLGAPLLHFFTSVTANKVYSLATIFLFFVFSYLLFARLSRNKLFAVFLTSVLVWSRSIYVALFFAGAGAFSANQMFTPLILYLITVYFQGQKIKWLLLAGVISGLSVAGHQGMSILFVFIPALLLLLFRPDLKARFFSAKRFKDLTIYIFFFLFSGALGLYPYVLSFLGSLFGFETNMGLQTSSWPRREAIRDLFAFNNIALYLGFGLAILFVVISRKFKVTLKKSWGFIMLFLYLFLFEVLMYIGKNPFSETLGADRAYWFLPLIFGGLAAIFVSEIRTERIAKAKISPGFIFKGLVIVVLAAGFIFSPNLYWFVKEQAGLARIMIPAENLMADPNEENKKEVMPAWLETSDKNHRLHTSAAITTWFNALYDLPVTTGYADPQGVKARSWAYWRDISLTGEAVEHFEVPKEIAKNNAFFLIDWYGIKYLEYSSQGFTAPDYLYTNPEFVEKEELMAKTGYNFYQAKDEYYSPIIRPTTSPTVLVISSPEGYNSFLRVLAQENLNSQYLIPIHYSEYIDDLTQIDLSDFDAVFLYDYRYKNEKNFRSYPEKPWLALADYVKAGGKLFLDTGSEVKESDISNLLSSGLPEVFPVTSTRRGDLGEQWQLGSLKGDGINWDKFDPLIYQDVPWKLSYSENEAVKDWAEVVLRQQEKPIVVAGNLDQGRVVWSGINLPYHTKSYNNIEEGRFFRELLSSLVALAPEKSVPYTFERNKSEEIKITSQNFKGILFKESNYGGWEAQIGPEKAGAYEAGVGMMYFPLASENQATIVISYRSLFIYWLMFILMGLTVFLALVFLILGDRAVFFFKKIFHVEKFKSQTHSWWDKDEE